MAAFKCKMCGGNLEITEGITVCECEYCGTKQTVPNADDEKKINLFNRANRLRSTCEFDKAAAIYESIVSEFAEEAEAYWGLCLCKFGIEYVDDSKTAKKIPTCHRTSYSSIFDDSNFELACEYADSVALQLYRNEAKEIDRLQKEILNIAKNEEPFDIFICYKESDENGQRTVDSELAHDLYDVLTEKGYKVFYSRITLKAKLGQDYEPYIFSALNSAKVMLAVGTKFEYYNAVWVKNEWSRYLALMSNNKDKMLIPCYKNIDAYDMPKEFGHLQAQDLSSPRAFQDLITNIERIVYPQKLNKPQKEAVVQQVKSANPTTETLIKRTYAFLEDEEWDKANEYCEKILDIDVENPQVYIYKICIDFKVKNLEELVNSNRRFNDNVNYEKAFRFSDENLKKKLKEYDEQVEINIKNGIYNQALDVMERANSERLYLNAAKLFKEAAKMFEPVFGFKDAEVLAKQCEEKAIECKVRSEVIRNGDIYASAMKSMKLNTLFGYEEAIDKFRSIAGWNDANEQMAVCQEKLKEENKRINEIKKKKRKKRIIAGLSVFGVTALLLIISIPPILNLITQNKYNREYNWAYNQAMELIDSGNYNDAYALLEEIDENDMVNESKYERAVEYLNRGVYKFAYDLFVGIDYKDSKELAIDIYFNHIIDSIQVGDYFNFGTYEQDDNINSGPEDIQWLVLAKNDKEIFAVSKYALDCKPFCTSNSISTTWDNSTLRQWLNNEFLETAFSEAEQNAILNSYVSADKNPYSDVNPGNDTQDKIFLLSYSEYVQYLNPSDVGLIGEGSCYATEYTFAQGIEHDGNYCKWWLRTPGFNDDILVVSLWGGVMHTSMGEVYEAGNYVEDSHIGVRPAMWIKIS